MSAGRSSYKNRSGIVAVTVKVSGIDAETTEDDIREVFEKFGEVHSVKIPVDHKTGDCFGYGLVNFGNDDVKELFEDPLFVTINGNSCKATLKSSSSSKKTSVILGSSFTNVYIKGYDRYATEEEIKNLFRDCGPVTSWYFPRKCDVDIDTESDDGEELAGFCFANFETHEYAVDAIDKMNDKVIAWIDHKPLPNKEAKKFIKEHQDRVFEENEFWGSLYVGEAQTKEKRNALNSESHKAVGKIKKAHFLDAVSGNRVLFISKVTRDISADDIYSFFSGEGSSARKKVIRKIETVYIFPYKSKSQVSTSAYIIYSTPEDCEWACSMGTVLINGVSLGLEHYRNKPKEEE